jgi:hypothetical protein
MSEFMFPSAGTMSPPKESNATSRPSAVMEENCAPAESPPDMSTLTRVVVPERKFRTNTSRVPLPSPGTRLSESE